MVLLHDELVQLMRNKAPYEEVDQKFFHRHVWEGQYHTDLERARVHNLYVCYLVHHGYQDLKTRDQDLFLDHKFNPFLTAVRESKLWFFDKTRFDELYASNEHAKFRQICLPAYGMFESDIIQEDRMTSVLNVIFERDDSSFFSRVLPLCRHAARALLLRAARRNARQCCQMLQHEIQHQADMVAEKAPAQYLSSLLTDFFRICDVTLENSLCNFAIISQAFSRRSFSSPLHSDDMVKVNQIKEDIDKIGKALNTSPANFSGMQSIPLRCDHDMELFVRVQFQSYKILLESQKVQTPWSMSTNQLLPIIEAFYFSYYKIGPVRQDHRLSCMKLLNKLINLLMHIHILWPHNYYKNVLTKYAEAIQKYDKGDVSVLLSEMLLIYMAYGNIRMDHSQALQLVYPVMHIGLYHDSLVETMFTFVKLLPWDVYDSCRERVMEVQNKLAQARSSWAPEIACLYQRVFDISDIWWRRECRSLQELCRHQVYQCFPKGKVPEIVKRSNVLPKPLKKYLCLDIPPL